MTANPQAAVTGSVANQAVQINQGSLSTQSYSRGHACNGAVISVAPYYLASESNANTTSSNSRSFGGQISLSVPLDGTSVELCKELARKRLEKERLDYELVRIKECINIFKSGFKIHPSSPFYPLCADVIPVSAVPKTKAPASSVTSPSS